MDRHDVDLKRAAERRGRRGELLATLMLVSKGYRIMGRRVRTKLGEIDLVVKSPSGVICFVEVKTREIGETALEALRIPQQMRIARAAELYLARQPALRGKGIRFDVVTLGSRGFPRHLPDAWRPEDWR
ncbi:MAG: YraN family protein [Alphaproteobacteria bacterium]|nr:YraN family protein [Alphaproteobacteria bacterium]MBV9063475.1 YraN family protein [Alphaproteobacteria bacterium]